MKIKIKYPPNYEEILKYFDVKGKPVVFTYGDTLYNPTNSTIPPDLMAHEETHEKQQAAVGLEFWWKEYLTNAKFRLSQEVEAYQNQYIYAEENYNRQTRRRLLQQISKDLASEIYGNLVTKDEARNLIIGV